MSVIFYSIYLKDIIDNIEIVQLKNRINFIYSSIKILQNPGLIRL